MKLAQILIKGLTILPLLIIISGIGDLCIDIPLCQDSFRLLKTKTRWGERNQESWGEPATRQS